MYILKDLTEADKDKIVKEASYNPELHSKFFAAKKHSMFQSKWALNEENGNYLLWEPIFTRPENLDTNFVLYCDSAFYLISYSCAVGENLRFKQGTEFNNINREKVEGEFLKAVEVHGRWGLLPMEKGGLATFDAPPKFIS